ncbi:MAG TPA: CHAD domain-containing protein [Rhodospirillaceae bacterium]|nr:CHAD domain-containing protein [Rhodospirillaceae bacterium]
MGNETELKFRLDKPASERLRRHPLIRRLKHGKAVTRQEKSVYFDTPGNDLRSRQSVLRVRSIGGRRVQTLKSADPSGAAWTRHEWQWDIYDDQPDCRLLASTPLSMDFPSSRLQPVFSTEIRRTTVVFGEADWQIEMVLDHGIVRAGSLTCPVNEAELELKAGDPAILFRVAQDLFGNIPAVLSLATKAERGFALLDQAAPKPVKAQAVALAKDQSSAAAFRRIALSCIGQLVANQEILAATGDPEAVHQMRVAVRRLRAAMSLFKGFLDTPETVAVKEDLRWLQSHLGPARDAEVFIAEVLDPVAAAFAGTPGFDRLRAHYAARRETLTAAVIGLLRHRRLTQTLLRLGAWAEGGDWQRWEGGAQLEHLQRPVMEAAVQALTRRDRKVTKGMTDLEQLDDHARHMLRIQVKKLRYSIDFFSSLYSVSRARKAAAALGELQDHLGLLNDFAVARDILKSQAEKQRDKTLLWVSGMIAGWHAARIPGLLRDAAGDWDAYRKLPRLWSGRSAGK